MAESRLRFGAFIAPFHPLDKIPRWPWSAISNSFNGSTSSPMTRPGSASTIRRATKSFQAPGGFHRDRRRADAPHQAGHRSLVAALPSAADAGRAHQPARPHHPRARDVRMRSGRAGVRRDDDGDRTPAKQRGMMDEALTRAGAADARRDRQRQNRMVHAQSGAAASGALLRVPSVEIAVANQISPPARARRESTASACCRSARPPRRLQRAGLDLGDRRGDGARARHHYRSQRMAAGRTGARRREPRAGAGQRAFRTGEMDLSISANRRAADRALTVRTRSMR